MEADLVTCTFARFVSFDKKTSSGDLWLVWTTNPIVEGRSKRSDLNLVNRTFLTIKDFV